MQSIEHNEVFDLAYRFITETNENIFLTGKAGTGKTTFLKYLKDHCIKNTVIAAPTGVAAINAGGVTLHSLFHLPFHPYLPTTENTKELLSKVRINKKQQQLLRKMELLIIDEISMVRCDVMDAIDVILKSIKHNYQQPFGGIQLLCIGDLYQLPPVVQNQEWNILSEYYNSPFFFDSHAIKEQMPLLIELKKIYRQKEESFVELLNKIRSNNMTPSDFEALHLRYQPGFIPNFQEKYITLTSHNNQADLINQQQLQKISEPSFSYPAAIKDEFPEHIYPAEGNLVLKPGAQVMFLKNDTVQWRYFNGKIGTVSKLDKEKVMVDCDGLLIEVGIETWENNRYTINRSDGKLTQETIGTFTQFPLRLAWAITIHKSQGLTFDKVMIDAGAAFSSGQVYVALSRCTSLNGIVLLSKIPPSAIYSNENIDKGQQWLTHKGSLAERFIGARWLFSMQLIENIFSFTEIVVAGEQLLFKINEYKDKLNTEAMVWIKVLSLKFSGNKAVGLKFIQTVNGLMEQEAVIEKNVGLQKRISDAANHFLPIHAGLLNDVQNHPLITEHKQVAAVIDEMLLQLMLDIYRTHYYIEYCKEAFCITAFLQHKLKFTVPRFSLSCYASGKKQTNTDIQNITLYDTLKRWRDMVCEETGLPIYMVANQATIKEVCLYLPLNKRDLQQIAGFGKAKSEKYGDEIIDIVEEYCTRYNLETNMGTKEVPQKKIRQKKLVLKTDTKTVSLDLYNEGKAIQEIAKERNLSVNTIETHLAHFIGLGVIKIDSFVKKEKQQLIRTAAAKHGTLSHKTLIENLPKGISYGEIKMVLATINRND